MSYHEYIKGREIEAESYPFYALIQAAMRQGDTNNVELLKAAWPKIWDELSKRYNAPDGILEGEA